MKNTLAVPVSVLMMKNKLAVLVAVAVVLLSVASSGFAQEPVAADPAAPAEAAPAEAAPAEGAPAEQPADAAPPAEAAPSDEIVGEYPRFRWGISFMGGPLVGATSGGAGGIDTRFGAQISDLLGIYVQPALMFGAGVDADNTNASASGLVVAGAGVLADFTFINLFYAGIGPEILYGGFASGSSTGTASAAAGTFFSLATRLGIALGSTTPEHKKRFTLGLDMHIVFVPSNVTVMPMIALGYDKF